MKRLIYNSLVPVILLLGSACSPEVLPTVLDSEDAQGRVYVNLDIKGEGFDTKASLLEGSENVYSGALVAVYYSSTGLMDSVQEIPADMQTVLSLPAGQEVDLFVLGNLWAIDKDDASKRNLAGVYAENFPSNVGSLKSFSYHLDGRDINSEYRHQNFSEIAEYGIPFVGSLSSRSYSGSESITVECRRLFSKISLTVDHSGLDGGENPDYFRNVKLYLRQANCAMMPFSDEPQRALSASDIIDGDYDPSMVNASKMCFDFYVPENMQGTLLPGNEDPELKDRDYIVSKLGSDLAGLLTYVEFTAEVSADAGGYGGPVTYRFYLGNDNCSNFDLQGNRQYDVTLGFRVSSLFEPDWKLSPDLSDNREIGICADAARSRLLPEGQMIAVRKNRPGSAYVYVKAGQGGVLRKPDGLCDSADPPASLTECALTSDFLSRTNKSEDVPMRSELEALGISAFYDQGSGLLSFVVTDQSRFQAGKELTLSLKTVPSGVTSTLRIKTFENMSASWDGSLSEDFVPGMSRTAVLEGFSSALSYRSTTTHCYKDEALPGQEGVIQSSYEANPQLESGACFKLYNFSNCSASGCYDSMFYLRPEDDFNDGNNDGVLDDNDALAFNIVNSWPYVEFYGVKQAERIELDAAGTEEEIYLTVGVRKSAGVKSLYMSDFDPEIFDFVYQPHLRTGFGTTELRDEEGNLLYSGGVDSHIGMAVTSKKTSAGWPIYDIYRSRIGEKYSIRQPVSYSGYYINYMPVLSDTNIFHARYSNQIKIAFLPFLSENFDIEFDQEYHDYTFWNADYLDYEYRKLAENSIAAPSGKNVDFGLKDRSSLQLYAKPTASTELDFTENGISQSVRIIQETSAGPLTMSFVETGTNMHTAGPHKIYASFTNKHSGEIREELLGAFDIYLHFAVGLDLDFLDNGGGSSLSDINVFPVLVSDVSRCSYSLIEDSLYPQIWLKNAFSFEYFGGNEAPGSSVGCLSFPVEPGVVGNRSYAVKVLPSTYDYEDAITSISPECRYDIFMYPNMWNDAVYYMELCQDYPYNICLLIHNKGNYEFCFDNGGAQGTKLFNDTAWSDLKAPDGKGYYHFQLLGDLRSDCGGWLPVFNHFTQAP